MNKFIKIFAGALLGVALLLSGLCERAAAGTEVLRSTLDNGLRVIIVVDRLAPVAAVQINYLVGANETPSGFPGTAHALEHMMFRGNPGLSADQFATIMAALGGDSNAATQQTATQYFVTTPVEELEAALRVEAIRMRGVLATEESVGQGAGSHRTGGCPGPVRTDVCLSHPPAGAYVRRHPLRH